MKENVSSSFTRPNVFEKDSQPPFRSRNDQFRRNEFRRNESKKNEFNPTNNKPDVKQEASAQNEAKQNYSTPNPTQNSNHSGPSQNKNRSKSEKEITISINPWRIGKIFLFILAFLVVFYAGRFSTVSTIDEQSTLSNLFNALSSEKDTSPSAAAVLDEVVEETVAEPVEPVEVPESVVEVVEPEPVVEKVVVKAPEKIITTYKYVTLSIDSAYFKWMDTWGKITGIKYTIKNNEGGTIKPDHFLMQVEGYSDSDKTFDVAVDSKTIKSKQSKFSEVVVPNGFSYNEATAGELTNVRISLYLYDASNKLIAHTSRDMDLSG